MHSRRRLFTGRGRGVQGGHHTRWACGVGCQEQSSGSALISVVEHTALA